MDKRINIIGGKLMKTLEEFKNFYDLTLYPKLCALDEERKKTSSNVVLILGAYTLVSIIICYLGITWALHNSSEISLNFIIFLVVIGGFIYHYLIRKYITDFKQGIVNDIAKFIDPSMIMDENARFSDAELNETDLFYKNPDHIYVSDCFKGEINQTAIKFCELHLTETYRTKNGSHTKTVFKGLYFIADCNKNFNGKTNILPDFAEKTFGRLGLFFQEKFSSNRLVKLENIDFEKEFVVYSDDQIEARYLISPALMDRILEFRKKTGREIRIAFLNSNIHIAIPYSKDLFEPTVFKTIINYDEIEQYYKDLMFFIEIVEDFNLNNRIWTKE